jgi:hypothetical protein
MFVMLQHPILFGQIAMLGYVCHMTRLVYVRHITKGSFGQVLKKKSNDFFPLSQR